MSAVYGQTEQQAQERETIIQRMESLAREGRLPSYEDLRLPQVEGRLVVERYVMALPLMADDALTTDVVFADVPEDEPYALMDLPALIEVTLGNNFDLINSQRSVEIALSDTRAEEAFFIPFVDLTGSARAQRTRNRDTPSRSRAGRTTQGTSTDYSLEAGPEITQNLPTGGSIFLDASEGRTSSRFADGDGELRSRDYDGSAGGRITQPLLRGSGLLTGEGTSIGTANLRRTRLNELQRTLDDYLLERDTVLRVIQQYFRLLQIKQQLLVSRDAIRERYRFLDETRVKYDVGRVAESEILRAEIQFLQEVETAINRQQQLDEAREQLLLILGLPLDTRISLIDITADLAARGRIEIPPVNDAVQLCLTRRRELMQADINIALGEIDRTLARNNTLPDLDFDAGYRTFDAGSDFEDANNFDRDTLDAGIGIRIPLQNIARREAHRQSILRLDQLKTNRLELERNLTQEVLSAHRAVLTTEARLTVLQKRVEQARRNLELINESFEVGFSTVTEVRLAQDDLFNTESSYSSAILTYQISLAELYRAMGLPLI